MRRKELHFLLRMSVSHNVDSALGFFFTEEAPSL